MSAHTFHPDTHEHGLADDCPRCAELAAAPFTRMDARLLSNLHDRTQDWMRDETFPRSDTERDAMRLMETHLVHARILARYVHAGAVAS